MAFFRSLIKGKLFSKTDAPVKEQESESRVASLHNFVDVLFE
jgi:hypothetical protein